MIELDDFIDAVFGFYSLQEKGVTQLTKICSGDPMNPESKMPMDIRCVVITITC